MVLLHPTAKSGIKSLSRSGEFPRVSRMVRLRNSKNKYFKYLNYFLRNMWETNPMSILATLESGAPQSNRRKARSSVCQNRK